MSCAPTSARSSGCIRSGKRRPEFLDSIVHASVFSAQEKALLAEFLEQADLLKFARQDATAAARRGLLAQAGEFCSPRQVRPPGRLQAPRRR